MHQPASHPIPASIWKSLAPLQGPAFRTLWVASLVANIGMCMNDVASAWLMTTLTQSAVMVALVQASAVLPVFLFGLPTGALADMIDHRRGYALVQLWATVVAVLLFVLSVTQTLTAPLLLALTLANGVGLVIRFPLFSTIIPNIVLKDDLPSALALNAIAVNLSRILGPAIAGLVLAVWGSEHVFILNAVLGLVAFALVMRWKSEQRSSELPNERLLPAMRLGAKYVSQSRRMRWVLTRTFHFMFQCAALTALLPLVARGPLGGTSTAYAVLLAGMGSGAILAALCLPRLRQFLSREQTLYWGSGLHSATSIVIALSPTLWLSVPAIVVAGMAFLATINSFSVAAQLALPGWVRARGMSLFQMSAMGGTAIGAVAWGYLAGSASVQVSIVAAGIGGPLLLLATRRMDVDHGHDEDLTPAPALEGASEPLVEPAADDGPVLVTIEYMINGDHVGSFEAVMQQTRSARLRQGVLSWSIFHDPATPGLYVEHFLDASWLEHQRRLRRTSASDVTLREHRHTFHVGAEPPRVRRYIGVRSA